MVSRGSNAHRHIAFGWSKSKKNHKVLTGNIYETSWGFLGGGGALGLSKSLDSLTQTSSNLLTKQINHKEVHQKYWTLQMHYRMCLMNYPIKLCYFISLWQVAINIRKLILHILWMITD